MKSWTLTCSGCPAGRHSLPPFLYGPTSSFFLVSTLITGSPGGQVLAGLVVEVGELGVAVGVLAALDGLGVGLQAEPLLVQQPGHGVRADPVPGRGQLRGQLAGRQRRPAQRRLRVPAPGRLHQRQQRRHQRRVGLRSPSCGPPPARRTRPNGASPASSSATPCEIRDRDAPVAPGHRRDPAMAQRPASAAITSRCCTLVQMRQHRLELRPQRRHHVRIDRHYHIMMYRIQNNVVIYTARP